MILHNAELGAAHTQYKGLLHWLQLITSVEVWCMHWIVIIDDDGNFCL